MNMTASRARCPADGAPLERWVRQHLRLLHLQAGTAQGYPLTRLVANMEWALEDRPGVNDVVEYETRLNYILPKYDDAVV